MFLPGLLANHVAGQELLVDSTFDLNADEWISSVQGVPPLFPPNGDWFLDTVGQPTPLSFWPTSSRGGGEGNYAVSDQQGSTEGVLLQVFTIPTSDAAIILSYDMFVNDWSSQPVFSPMQHARVDLMDADAPLFDTTVGVVGNFYLGTDGGPLPNQFTHYEFDIAPFVSAGQDYAIRFYEINSVGELNLGVDNVSVFVVPEPSTLLLAFFALALALALVSKQRVPRFISAGTFGHRRTWRGVPVPSSWHCRDRSQRQDVSWRCAINVHGDESNFF